jgi:hypothetical protein
LLRLDGRFGQVGRGLFNGHPKDSGQHAGSECSQPEHEIEDGKLHGLALEVGKFAGGFPVIFAAISEIAIHMSNFD